DFGVPQRRRRFIFLAGRFGKPSLAKADAGRKTVRDAIYSLPKPGKSNDKLHDLGEVRSARIASLIKNIPKNGGSRNDLGPQQQLPCHRKCDGFKDVYGRMGWCELAPTITGGCVNPSKGRFLHPSQNRAITLREAALLQSFPQCYRVSLDKGKYPAAA